MEINYKVEDNRVLVKLTGELDTPATEKIQPDIDRLLDMCNHDITIDCAKLTYIASSGLRQLLALRKATRANGTAMTLTNMCDAVMNVFKITNFDRLFGMK